MIRSMPKSSPLAVASLSGAALLVLATSGPAVADSSTLTGSIGGNDNYFLSRESRGDVLSKIRKAYSDVLSHSKIRSLVKDSAIHQLSLLRRESGLGVESTIYQHYYKGVEVMGSKATHHFGKLGGLVRNRLKQFDLSVVPQVSSQDAARLASSYGTGGSAVKAPDLKILPRDDGSANLVYVVEVNQDDSVDAHGESKDVYLDAHSGQLIASISAHQEIAPVQVFDAKGRAALIDLSKVTPTTTVPRELLSGCQLVDSRTGNPLVVNPRACAPVVVDGSAQPQADAEALQALANSQAVLSYYKETHGRESFDNRASAAVNVVHVGINFPNAFWNSRQNVMAYGDGDGERFGSFAGALDVAGHEMTHGVISSTAKLVYMGESGALNEAYADFFGKMIAQSAGRDDVNDWTIGKKLGKAADFPGIRDLQNPASLGAQVRAGAGQPARAIRYPATYAERQVTESACERANDNCFVHINSTIPGHAAYRVVQAIGREKAQKLYYATLTQALGETETFKSAANATLTMCRQLEGFDEATCEQVRSIYQESGIL